MSNGHHHHHDHRGSLSPAEQDRSRSRSRHGSHSRTAAVASAAVGAAAAIFLDTQFLEDKTPRHRHHGDVQERRSSHHASGPLRRLADIALGGYAGYEAYDYVHNKREKRRGQYEDRSENSRAIYDDDDDDDNEQIRHGGDSRRRARSLGPIANGRDGERGMIAYGNRHLDPHFRSRDVARDRSLHRGYTDRRV